MTEHDPLPVHGYTPQRQEHIDAVNHMKQIEETILRVLDAMQKGTIIDQRWLSIGRTHIEQGFMAVNRSIFNPQRIRLPSDPAEALQS